MPIKEDVTTALHPTEIYNPSSGLTALADGFLLSVPPCWRSPLGLSSTVSLSPVSPAHRLAPFYTDSSRMETPPVIIDDIPPLKDADREGLKIAIIGFFIESIGPSITYILSSKRSTITRKLVRVLNILIAMISVFLCLYGTYLSTKPGRIDKIPGIGGKIGELIKIFLTTYPACRLAQAMS